jgi:hypothetical protein
MSQSLSAFAGHSKLFEMSQSIKSSGNTDVEAEKVIWFNNLQHTSWEKAFEAFQKVEAQAKPNAVWHRVYAKRSDRSDPCLTDSCNSALRTWKLQIGDGSRNQSSAVHPLLNPAHTVTYVLDPLYAEQQVGNQCPLLQFSCSACKC